MGSYNSSCDITGLPISGAVDEPVFLMLYTTDKSSYHDSLQFLGTPFRAKYFDYGDYILQSESPFVRQLAPDFENMTGIALLGDKEDEKYFTAQSRRGINLWDVPNQFLHLFHDLILMRPKWALNETNVKYSLNITSVLDWEGSKSSRVALRENHPEAWAYYLTLLGECPASYDDRATVVHRWLRDEDLNVAKQTCLELVKDETQAYQKIIEQTFLTGVPNALELVKEAFSERIVSKIRTASVYEKAFNALVDCTKKQIKEQGCNYLYSQLQSCSEDPDYAKQLEKLKIAVAENNQEEMLFAKMLLGMMRNTLSRDKNFKLAGFFAGNAVTPEDIQASKDLVLFVENFYHGFKFSSMSSNRQYEGIAHIVAQAKTTIEIARNVSKNFYKQGKWETYQYKP